MLSGWRRNRLKDSGHGATELGGALTGREEDDGARPTPVRWGTAAGSNRCTREKRNLWRGQFWQGMHGWGSGERRSTTAAVVAKQGMEKRKRRRWVLLFIEGEGASNFASSRTRSPRWQKRVTVHGSGEDDRRRQLGGEQAVVLCCQQKFWNIYRIATESILQITPKFSKEVENLQKWKLLNFSISTTLLQWTFSNSASILKFEFGVHLSIWIFSQLLQILYVNLKNFEYQSWST